MHPLLGTPGAPKLGWDECLAQVAGKTVIDIGAHMGGYTSVFIQHDARRVVAVEPGPQLAAGLRDRFARHERVVVRQQGVSDAPGRLEGVRFHNCWTLGRPGELTGRIGAQSPSGTEIEGDRVFDVELTTLDALVADLAIADLALLKIDVDGYEPQVLRGGMRTLAEQRPVALLELSYLPHELGESIDDFIAGIYRVGYTLATLEGQRVSQVQVLAGFPWHTSCDVMMLPVERFQHWPSML